jgi:hypothetical protein
MNPNDFRVARRPPLPATVPEVADEFLFLRIDRNDGLATPLKRGNLPVDDAKLLVPMRVRRTFQLFAPTLKGEMKTFQLTMDGFPTERVPEAD